MQIYLKNLYSFNNVRRQLTLGIKLLAVMSIFVSSISAANADRIWLGGKILTMNDSAMHVEAVAEKDGKIIAVGSREDVLKFKGRNTKIIDLKSQTMLPGFVDAHGHVMMGGLQALAANLLAKPDGNVTDIASLQQTMRDWIAENREVVAKVNIIIGFGYDNSQLKEQRHPTREDLDQISKDIPILLAHQSGHLSSLNSKALEVVGYTSSSKDPEGGVIRRQAGSLEPDGVLEETAHYNAIYKLLPALGAKGLETFAREGAKLWAKYGYTTAQEGRSTPGTANVLKKVAEEGGFEIDVVTYPDVLVDRKFIKENVSSKYKKRYRVAGAKLTIDGSPQGFTAWRDRPYYKPVGTYPKGYSGYAAVSVDNVMDAISWASENDIQIITHANGERALDLLISSHQAAQARFPKAKENRPVLIHGQFLRADQLDSFKTLNVIPSLFPMHTYYWGDWHAEHTVGPELAQNISPTRWALDRGMIFTSHHDAPVAFPNSMRVLDATVTRRARGSGQIIGPDQRVDVITALKAMTIWPAYQHFEEQTKGSIEVGKLADFVILSDDPTSVKPTTIADIRVTETIKEGNTVFRLAETYVSRKTDSGTLFLNVLSKALENKNMSESDNNHHHDSVSCQSDLLMQLANSMLSSSLDS